MARVESFMFNLDNVRLDNIFTLWQCPRNESHQWRGEDNIERFQYNKKHKADMINYHNWTENSITYNLNEYGFRIGSLDIQSEYFCAFGCSYTFGDALPYDAIYTSLIANKLGIGVHNFGVSGGSNCTNARNALTWLPKLKPRFVILQTTFDQRFEWIGSHPDVSKKELTASIYGIVAKGGSSVPELNNNKLFENWVLHDENRAILKAKNLATVKWLCYELNIPVYEIDVSDFELKHLNDSARDCLHHGPESHKLVAEKLLEKIDV